MEIFVLGSAYICSSFTYKRFTMSMSKYLGANPVFVAGGSSGVGLEVIKKLSALGNNRFH